MNKNQRTVIANQFKNTPLGFLRVKKNLKITQLSDTDTKNFLREIIISTPLEAIERKGKNHYFMCTRFNAILTVNANTLTIITAKIMVHPANEYLKAPHPGVPMQIKRD